MKRQEEAILNINALSIDFNKNIEDFELVVGNHFSIYLNPKYATQKIDNDFIHKLIMKGSLDNFNNIFVGNENLFYHLLNNEVDVFDCDSIYLPFSEEAATLLKNNDYKNVIIDHEFDFNKETCDKLVEMFGDRDNIRICLKDELSFISISEYEKTIYALHEVIDKIKKYDLSPLEQLVYAYDLVRERVYQKEDIDEDAEVSRKLSSVLFGDKIVCVGYVSFFNAILDELGIYCKKHVYLPYNKDLSGHVRSMVYVKDDKYNMDGYYMFDPTWDSRKNSMDNNYLSSYRFFCQNINVFRFYDSVFKKGLYDGTFSYDMVNLVNGTYRFCKELLEKKYFNEFSEESQEFVRTLDYEKFNYINNISKFFSGEEVIKYNFLEFKDSFIEGSHRLLILPTIRTKPLNGLMEKVKKLNSSLSSYDKILDAIYTVRKIEYYEDPINHPFDVDMIDDIYINNTIEKSIAKKGLPEMSLGCALFNISEDEYYSDVLENAEEKEKELGLVKFTKTLKLINESRKK